MSDAQGVIPNAGASADQYVTGSEEEGDFITDKAPAADTPASGSSNAGVNAEHANRVDADPDADEDING